MISVRNPLLQTCQLCYLYYILFRDLVTGSNCLDLLVSGRFRKASGSLSGSLHFFSQFHRSSGRFRKVHGSLSGSLFRFCLYFSSSGRFRKAPGFLSGSLFQLFGLLHSGRFRKVSGTVTGRITKHQLWVFGS